MGYPRMLRLRQRFDAPRIDDIPGEAGELSGLFVRESKGLLELQQPAGGQVDTQLLGCPQEVVFLLGQGGSREEASRLVERQTQPLLIATLGAIIILAIYRAIAAPRA